MLLLRNLLVFSPENIGVNDIFVCNEQICEISKRIIPGGIECDTIDFEPGKYFAVPGFIDGHVHLIGGGGEGGYITRTREGTPEEFLNCGTTTVIGLLGTDGITRNHVSLLAKARAFREKGISSWILTGSYKYPIQTITDDHMKDMVLIPEVLGVGELAIADHRGSGITGSELKRLALDIRVAGMISGKKGVIVCHMGNAPEGMAPLFEATNDCTLPATHLIPTHVSRKEKLLEEGIKWVKERQGFIDLTASRKTTKILIELKMELGNLDNVCVSTDGLGSLPVFNESGVLKELKTSPVNGLLMTFRELLDQGLDVEEALKPVCTTPAKALGIDRWGYGTLIKKSPASLLVFNAENLELEVVISSGKIMVNHL